ncbi:MAG: extracellular solute-binding protein [Chloroflexota bacterium]
MQKKIVSIVLIFVLGAMFSTVAAQDDAYADVDPSGATISYWHEWDGLQGTGMTAVIELFNSTNEWGITVEELPLGGSSDVRSNISTAITSGDLPNLGGAGFASDAMGYFLDGVLVPFDPFLESATWGLTEDEASVLRFDVIDRNRPALAPFNGQLLAWPIGTSGEIMSTNLDLLDQMREQGLIDFEGTPANVEEFRAAACAASELEGVTAGYGARTSGGHILTWMSAFGGQIFDTEADAYVFTDEGALEALQFVQDMFNDGCLYFADGGTFANTGEFSLGLNVFAPGSSVGVPFIQGDMDTAVEEGVLEEAYNWVNVPFPAGPAGTFIAPTLRGVTIFESTPEENLATWLFVKFLSTNSEAQQLWIENAQYQPINGATTTDYLSEEFLGSNAQFASYADALQDPDVQFIDTPEHPQSFPVSQSLDALFSNITIGGMDVMEAAMEAEEAANEIYQEDLENLADFE